MAIIPRVILLIDSSTERGRGLLRGIARYSRLYGPWAFYWRTPFYRESAGAGKELYWMKKLSADAIVVRDTKDIEKVIAMGLPTVSAAYSMDQPTGVPTFTSDYVAAGKMAAEYFLERGFRNFAFCGFDEMYWSRQRGGSFGKRVAEAGFATNYYEQPKSRSRRSWEDEQTFLADWLKSLPKPVGLMTCNDDRSQHVIEACKIVGVHVPEEIAILGVDNDKLICELSEPPLSSIAHNPERIGYEIAELLDKMMAGQKITDQQIVDIPTGVITRQSTNVLAIDDREIAAAVRFIRQHSKQVIQVSDVAEAAALSRRNLEQRFRKALGRSVLHEIKRVRIDEIIRMLIETNLSISQIASALGYSSINNIARYFRKEKGVSLSAFRKQYGNK